MWPSRPVAPQGMRPHSPADRPGRHGVIAVASDGAAFGLRLPRRRIRRRSALVAGMAADLPGLAAAVWLVAGLTGIPGFILAARRYETQRRGRTGRRCRARPQP
jgi:hypothetical protein